MKIKFYHFQTKNTGDLMCAPYHYFDFPGEQVHNHIRSKDLGECDAAIFGGGAVVGTMFNTGIAAQHRARVKVGWGIGSTKWGAHKRMAFQMPRGLDLLGCRDWPNPDYVPCVSCMHELFDRSYEPTREAVLFINADGAISKRVGASAAKGVPCLTNHSPIEKIIPWLGSGEVVLTNSYHGAYWAQLLGRKVILVNPYSSKFFNTRYAMPFVRDGQDWKERVKEATIVPGFLEESRSLNQNFYRRTMELIDG